MGGAEASARTDALPTDTRRPVPDTRSERAGEAGPPCVTDCDCPVLDRCAGGACTPSEFPHVCPDARLPDARIPDAPPPDARLPDAPACPVAVSAFDATPSPLSGETCMIPNALATDGVVAGLDCTTDGVWGTIDGVGVEGCVGVDFGAAQALDPVLVRAQPTAKACTVACSSLCGTGDGMDVFYGSTLGSYRHAASVAFTTGALADYSVTLGVPARYVVVCRGDGACERDDVAVDSIRSGRCP